MAPVVKNPPANAGDIRNTGLTLGSGRSPGGGHGHPLQYSCLENPMDREAWQATVHWVGKSPTGLKQLSTHTASLLGKIYSLNFAGMNSNCAYKCLISAIRKGSASEMVAPTVSFRSN